MLCSATKAHVNGDKAFQQIEVVTNSKTSDKHAFITKEADYNDAINFINNVLPTLYCVAYIWIDENMNPIVPSWEGP